MPREGVWEEGENPVTGARILGDRYSGFGALGSCYGRNQYENCTTVGKCLGKPIWIELCRFPEEREEMLAVVGGRRRVTPTQRGGKENGQQRERDGGEEQKEEMWKRKEEVGESTPLAGNHNTAATNGMAPTTPHHIQLGYEI